MTWRDNILEDNEQLIIRSQPHKASVLVPFALLVIMFTAGIYGVAFWFCVVLALAGALKSLYFEYLLTDKRIISKYGFFYIRYREIPIDKIDNIICWQNPKDKLFGTGLITLFGTGIRQIKFCRIANAMDFKHAIYSQLSTEPEHYFEK
ncbi:PH domain-containing protein [Rhodohalobacter sp. 8-1]|uniref:PH domain-containing protein n=1 Tax=Rhodohalobacter sp. 8-1 TaxID=3131972 RepID=UPI0030ED2A23